MEDLIERRMFLKCLGVTHRVTHRIEKVTRDFVCSYGGGVERII